MKAGWSTQKLADICEVFADGDWIETKDQSTGGVRLIQTGNVGVGVFKDRGEKARYVTAYNADYSDRPFADKRDMPDHPEKALRLSPLKLNQGLGAVETWSEAAIQDRAKKLAELAVGVWTAPALPHDILEAYGPKPNAAPDYTIDDHPNLLSPAMRPLFEEFRRAVLALDPCVSEEFLKLYVAYKAETNFVDVVPQAKRLGGVPNSRGGRNGAL
jgi:hypothetical protein